MFGALLQFYHVDEKYRPGEACAVAQVTIADMLHLHPSTVCRAEAKLYKARLIDADRKPLADHDELCRRLKTRDGRPVARGFIKVETKDVHAAGLKRAFLAQGLREVKGRNKHNAYKFNNDPFPVTARELGSALGRCVNTTLKYLKNTHRWLISIVAAAPGHARNTRFLSPSEIDKFAKAREIEESRARIEAERELHRLAVVGALAARAPAASAPKPPEPPPPLPPSADDAARALYAVKHWRPPPEDAAPLPPPVPTELADAADALVRALRDRPKTY